MCLGCLAVCADIIQQQMSTAAQQNHEIQQQKWPAKEKAVNVAFQPISRNNHAQPRETSVGHVVSRFNGQRYADQGKEPRRETNRAPRMDRIICDIGTQVATVKMLWPLCRIEPPTLAQVRAVCTLRNWKKIDENINNMYPPTTEMTSIVNARRLYGCVRMHKSRHSVRLQVSTILFGGIPQCQWQCHSVKTRAPRLRHHETHPATWTGSRINQGATLEEHAVLWQVVWYLISFYQCCVTIRWVSWVRILTSAIKLYLIFPMMIFCIGEVMYTCEHVSEKI